MAIRPHFSVHTLKVWKRAQRRAALADPPLESGLQVGS